jgi:rSAM/selenodomain-associated transferase 1
VLVFVKEPRAGFVKTRLAREIGPAAALALYRAFAKDEFEWLAAFPAVERRLCFTPRAGRQACLGLLPAGGRDSFRPVAQRAGGLGIRLLAAFDAAFRARFRPVVAIGTDAPLLSPAILEAALLALGRKDAVIGPARDGGYYLVGLRRFAPDLFEGIPWSTGDVLRATLARARRARLATALLEPLLDVDTAADLPLLERDLRAARAEGAYQPRRTARALLAWKRKGGAFSPRRRARERASSGPHPAGPRPGSPVAPRRRIGKP